MSTSGAEGHTAALRASILPVLLTDVLQRLVYQPVEELHLKQEHTVTHDPSLSHSHTHSQTITTGTINKTITKINKKQLLSLKKWVNLPFSLN